MPNQQITQTKKPLNDKEMVDHIIRHEGHKPYIYRDHLGNATVGGGFHIPSEQDAVKYRFRRMPDKDKFGDPATEGEIKDAFRKVKQKPHGQQYGADLFDPFNENVKDLPKIGIPEEESREKIRGILERSEVELRTKLPNFGELPYPAQKALMDMQYNIGDVKFRDYIKDKNTGEQKPAWPSLYDAVSNRDFARAAKESNRKDVSDARNKEIRELFLKAQKERDNQ